MMQRMVGQFFVEGEYRKGRIHLHHGGKDHIVDVGQHIGFSTSLWDFLEQDSDWHFEFVLHRNFISLIGTQFLT